MEGLILAGGRSSRMGSDKALLQVGGIPLLRLLAERMSGQCERVWVACGEEARAPRYEEALSGLAHAELRFTADIVPGCGPLSGLHAALTAMPEGWAFVMACDMPGLSEPLLQRMQAAAREAERADRPAAVIHAPGQPLHALYHTRSAAAIQAQLEGGDYRFMSLFDTLEAVVVEPTAEEAREAFRNLNTPEAYADYTRHET